MAEFAQYYMEFLTEFFKNFGEFFVSSWNTISKALFKDIGSYFETLIRASNSFKTLGWIAELVVIIVTVSFVSFLCIRIFQILRRYIRFTRREIEKDALLEEIASLNLMVADLVDEKNKILALKVSNLGFGGAATEVFNPTPELDAPKQERALGPSRFVKLIAVDEEYRTKITSIMMGPEDMLNLPDLITRFVNYSASQLRLFYDKRLIRAYFAGMATSKILILQGISGTGKTSLPYAMGKFFKNDSEICSVQPSWRDRTEIIGYLNEFTKRFTETDFLKAVYKTTYRDDMNFIILDEMNLARIEYYFAEFLSIMEMPDINEWKIDIVAESLDTDPMHLKDGKILIPQNVWFVGTANRDDSTFTITDKVYDRAITLEMNARAEYIDAPYTENISMSFDYLEHLFQEGIENNPLDTKLLEKISKLDEFIAKNFKITFGNRIMKQIKSFVPVYVACGGTDVQGLDYFLAYKILRKFESLNLSFLHDELNQLIALFDKLFGKGLCTECSSYIQSMIKNS